ncbi:MAG: hemerythrin domain-containing protein [candidate division Zixibacteria bacterium]|nr:hemerythrin domain-containing protein [candidate division Zixibacteria bacterium]MDH3936283.1 hemerythrin domain-containing protein [candidate division Zixibacteria bacterium]MDH4034838.1 hemerythrin domain-containing protein [candidate division Zixibacteria bacterium]
MALTDNLVKQHADLVRLVEQISAHLEVDKVTNETDEISDLLSQLAGKLTMHLAMEDKSLYPKLLGHRDDKVKQVTQKYIDEMGQLAEAFQNYLEKWRGASAKRDNAQGFIDDTKAVFGALDKRIKSENSELYPLVESC